MNVTLPKGISIVYHDDYIEIIRNWISWAVVSYVVLAMILCAVSFSATLAMIKGASFLSVAFFLLMMVCTAPFLYKTLAILMNNKTHVFISKNVVEIVHQPMPWFGARIIQAIDIKQVEVIHHEIEASLDSSEQTYMKYDIQIMMYSGESETVLSDLICDKEAYFIVENIEQYLSLESEPDAFVYNAEAVMGTRLPKHINIDYYEDYMEIIRSWFTWGIIFYGFILAGSSLFTIFAMRQASIDPSAITISFFVLVLLCNLLLLYLTLAILINNKTHIFVSEDVVEIVHKPMPWFGGRTIQVTDIKHIYIKQRGFAGYSGTKYYTRIMMHSGKSKALIPPLPDNREASFIAKNIAQYLGFEEQPDAAKKQCVRTIYAREGARHGC